MLNLPHEFQPLVSPQSRFKYYSSNPLKRLFLERFFKNVQRMIGKTRGAGCVLEVGCGDGLAAYLVTRAFPGLDYLGGDLNATGLGAAQKILHRDLVMLDGRQLPFADNRFDLSLFLEVFEHARDWEKLIQEGVRVSRSALILSVPAWPWYQISNLAFGKYAGRFGEHPEHVNQFSLNSLAAKIENAINSSGMMKSEVTAIEIISSFPWAIARLSLK